jgi:hypothetical protein
MSNEIRVATVIDDVREVHMGGQCSHSDYDTACGIDMNDPSLGHLVDNCTNTKDHITCAACIGMWEAVRKYTPSDFAIHGRK